MMSAINPVPDTSINGSDAPGKSNNNHHNHHDQQPIAAAAVVVAATTSPTVDNGGSGSGAGADIGGGGRRREGSSGGGGGGSGGFTAVNGIINKPSNAVSSPSLPPPPAPPPAPASVPAPAPASAPAPTPAPALSIVSQPIPSTNGHTISTQTTKRSSSPIVNAIYPRRPSSSNSEHSPPIRKRSYQEALGDNDNDEDDEDDDDEISTSPQKEGEYSERKYADDELSRHSGENEEQRLAREALRRESQHSRRESLSVNGDDRSYLDYERTPAGALIDMDRKKRKRVFSNRTKTGCMTCRKRKKKCDEMHPECKLSYFFEGGGCSI